jgi:lysozyme family protein
MAEFAPIYERMILDEGGYRLTNVAGDRGGQTYAGIARNRHPGWVGWSHIDKGETPPTALVREFYRSQFWNPIRGDQIVNQIVANDIFNFAVNAGVGIAVKLAQITVGVASDGVAGPVTLAALNKVDPHDFNKAYALAKIARYRDIVQRDRSQSKFLLGWINRTLSNLV